MKAISVSAILVAGGSGSRMNQSLPKQFMLLNGRPLLYYTLQTFLKSHEGIEIILVLPENHLHTGQDMVKQFFPDEKITCITGGHTRFHSVQNGLHVLNGDGIVLVHDAVRCLVSVRLIQSCIAAAIASGSAIPVIPVHDSVRTLFPDGSSEITDRSQLRLVQTPQTFWLPALQEAFSQPYRDSFTDEASVMEAAGHAIQLVDGEAFNIKITRPDDLLLAEAIMQLQSGS